MNSLFQSLCLLTIFHFPHSLIQVEFEVTFDKGHGLMDPVKSNNNSNDSNANTYQPQLRGSAAVRIKKQLREDWR